MANLRSVFNKSPGAWTAAKPYNDGSGDLFLQNGKWTDPNTTVPPAEGQTLFLARLGPGQVLGIETGGVYAVDPPVSP